MSTTSRSGKTKTAKKPAAKARASSASASKSKASAKPATKSTAKAAPPAAAKKTKTSSTSATKSRLAGPKPPKTRASATKSGAKRPAATVTPSSASTSRIPAPPTPASKPAAPAELKKPELIDLVVAKSDVKKKYAKPVVEAMLEVLGETLGKGREMNLQPFGKVKYNRTKETTSARVVVAKVRQSKSATKRAEAPKTPLADAAE